MGTVILVYGLPRGCNERWQECLLAESCKTNDDIERVKAAARADGFHSFRVASVDLGKCPSALFRHSVNV